MTVALGKNYDAIVVDTAETCMQCVKYLKRQRLGAFMFLPLDNLKIKPIKEHLRSIDPKAKLVIDCIEFDEKYHRVMQFSLGNTLIIDNLNLAKKFAMVKGDIKL